MSKIKISKTKNVEAQISKSKIVEIYILMIVLMYEITEVEYGNKNAPSLK
jgi:hypothetical protein